jgi:hypothetical protein
MVRVVWHVRGTAEHGITSLVYSERMYDNGRRGPGRSAGRTAVTVAGLARPRDGRAIQRALSAWEPPQPPRPWALICGRWFLDRPRPTCFGPAVWPGCGPATEPVTVADLSERASARTNPLCVKGGFLRLVGRVEDGSRRCSSGGGFRVVLGPGVTYPKSRLSWGARPATLDSRVVPTLSSRARGRRRRREWAGRRAVVCRGLRCRREAAGR